MATQFRGLILEIAGCTVAIGNETGLPVNWGTLRTGLVAPPVSPTLSVDPRTSEADAGGTSVLVTQIDDLLTQYKTSPVTYLTTNATSLPSTLNVVSTTGFPDIGYVWVGKNAIAYTGKTGTTFTGCSWAELGTTARNELAGAVVHGFNPEILDRQAWLYWYDHVAQTKTLRFTGFIDDIDITPQGTQITILSAKKKLIEQRGLAKPFARGHLLQAMSSPAPDPCLIAVLDPEEAPFDGEDGQLNRLHVRIDDEIIEYRLFLSPRFDPVEVTLVPGTNQVRTGVFGAGFFVGETVDIFDGATLEDTVQITEITQVSTTVFELRYTSTTGYTPSIGDELHANYSVLASNLNMKRGAVGTEIAEHEAGTEVREVRVLEGDQLEDILFPLLFSVDGTGVAGPSSGKWDRLPSGWGLGLDASLVDVDALVDALQSRTAYRRYRMEDSWEIEQLLRWIAISTNAAIFWDERGVLTCVARSDLYPGTTARLSLSIEHERIPGMRISAEHIINSTEWNTDYGVDGNPTRIIRVEQRESLSVRDSHVGEPVEDVGVLASRAREQMHIIYRGLLQLRSLPVPVIELDALVDETNPYRPGELVLLDIPAFPNLQGGQGLYEFFEIIDVSPADPTGRVSLTLMMRRTTARVGLIAPWAEVESVDGTSITLKPQAQTYAAPPGTEDVELFGADYKIEFWDVSSFGSGAVNRFATTISSVLVGSRLIVVSAVPGSWTLAAGDLVRFDDYSTVKASTHGAELTGKYIALASGSPPMLGADEPHVWGV